MPQRVAANQALILATYEQTRNGRETARLLGLHENTVYQALKRQRGRCPQCGQEVATGRVYCEPCRQQTRAHVKAKRKERMHLGLCQQCTRPIEPPSRLYCAAHRIQHLEAGARSHSRQVAKRGAPHQGISRATERERGLRHKYGEAGVAVWRRDNASCVLCGVGYGDKAIHVHHIDGDDSHSTEDNMACLCFNCHRLAHLLAEHRNPRLALDWLQARYPQLR